MRALLCVQLWDQDVWFISKFFGFVQGAVCKHQTRSHILSLQELVYLDPMELVFRLLGQVFFLGSCLILAKN